MMDIVDEGEWERPARPWPEGGETSEGPPGECRDIGGIKKAGLWPVFYSPNVLYLKGFNGFCASVPPFVPPDELGVGDSRKEKLTQMIDFTRKLGSGCAISSRRSRWFLAA